MTYADLTHRILAHVTETPQTPRAIWNACGLTLYETQIALNAAVAAGKCFKTDTHPPTWHI